MAKDQGSKSADRHILSRFDGDLGHFRGLVLEMGRRVVDQVTHASEAFSAGDAGRARRVLGDHRLIRELDMEALEANARLYAIHQPVARDLRLVLTLSRTVYDLERIGGEVVRLADIAELLYEHQAEIRDYAIFEDVRRITPTAVDLLQRSLKAVADEDAGLAVEVARGGTELEALFNGSLRRLATYLMEDPRNIRWVIDATLGVKAIERVGDHACSIARNVIYSVTGKDVRYVNVASLAP